MAILEADRLHCLGDSLQIGPVDGDIHVASQAGGQRIDAIYVAKNGEYANDLTANSGSSQRCVKTLN